MTCLDKAKTLTFLDVGWKGEHKGRVTIRLMGDTQRGRQFVAMCMGDSGVSLRNNSFHRIWWRGKAGQNIWGGDLQNGNGSGCAPLLKFTDEEKKSIPPSRNLLIRAGLVAGSYETDDVSTIFRIYTRDAAENDAFAFSEQVEETKDPAGFGQVEFGLDVLVAACELNNIQDLTIFDCGIIIET